MGYKTFCGSLGNIAIDPTSLKQFPVHKVAPSGNPIIVRYKITDDEYT